MNRPLNRSGTEIYLGLDRGHPWSVFSQNILDASVSALVLFQPIRLFPTPLAEVAAAISACGEQQTVGGTSSIKYE